MDTTIFFISFFFIFQSVENKSFQLFCKFRIVLNALFGSIAALSQFGIVVTVPGTALLDDAQFSTQIDDFAAAGNTFTKHDVEFSFAERRSNFVLYYFHAYLVTDHFFSVFQLVGTPDVQTYGSIEFQGVTAGGCFRIAEHDTDFLTQLIDEDTGGIGFADGRSQFTKSLRHQSRL